jgi:hypothetical protein
MAFPATYNFSYYKGDTLEFRAYPKDTSGLPFSLEGYDVSFTISTARGSEGLANQVPAFAEIIDNASILCAIRPEDSLELPSASSYVYDVEIRKPGATPYPLVYTILTGTITVEDQVTDIQVSLPEGPTNLVVTEDGGVVTINWDAPETGDQPTSYNVYGKSDALGLTTYVLISNVPAPATIYELSSVMGIPLTPGVQYEVKVTSVNSAGENSDDFVTDEITVAL